MKIYTIQLGKYTFTNIDDTPWGNRKPESTGLQWLIDSLSAMFNFKLPSMNILIGYPMIAVGAVLTGYGLLRKEERYY
jgi:hypothetical protein